MMFSEGGAEEGEDRWDERGQGGGGNGEEEEE